MRTRFFIQDLHTPAPENKQFKLINLPFYYVCQLDRVLDEPLSLSVMAASSTRT